MQKSLLELFNVSFLSWPLTRLRNLWKTWKKKESDRVFDATFTHLSVDPRLSPLAWTFPKEIAAIGHLFSVSTLPFRTLNSLPANLLFLSLIHLIDPFCLWSSPATLSFGLTHSLLAQSHPHSSYHMPQVSQGTARFTHFTIHSLCSFTCTRTGKG